MGLVIKLAYAAVVFGIGAIIFAVLEEYDLGHWFGIVLCLGALLPWGVDLFQGNQVRCFRGEYGKGVCGTLKQDAYVVALFVDDEVSSWTSEEIEVFMESNVKDSVGCGRTDRFGNVVDGCNCIFGGRFLQSVLIF